MTEQVNLAHRIDQHRRRRRLGTIFLAIADGQLSRQRVDQIEDVAEPGALELLRLNMVENERLFAVVCVVAEAVDEANEAIDRVLSEKLVALLDLVVVVGPVVELEVELERLAVDSLENGLHEAVVLLSVLVQPAALAHVHHQSRVHPAHVGRRLVLVHQHLLLEHVNELESFVGEAALLDHEKHVMDAIVDEAQNAAQLVQYVRGVEVRTAEADRVDDAEALAGVQLEAQSARAGILAHLALAAADAVHVAALVENAVAQRRLAHARYADQHDRFGQSGGRIANKNTNTNDSY